MTHPLLESTYAKLDRAGKHLHDLKSLVAEYSITEPEGLTSRFEEHVPEEGNQPGVAVRVDLRDSPDPQIPLVAGDVIQNTRSALDHLINAVVIRNGQRPTHRTQFPIHVDRLGPKGGVRDIEIEPRASKLANSLVEKLQPYHRVDDPTVHPLAVLQDLSNIDKHRQLHVIAGYAGKGSIEFFSPLFPQHIVEVDGLYEDGELVAYLPLDNPVLTIGMEVYLTHSVEVALREFRNRRDVSVGGLLDELYLYVREKAVDRFCRRVFRETPPPTNVLGLTPGG